jgi:hypothetical protein
MKLFLKTTLLIVTIALTLLSVNAADTSGATTIRGKGNPHLLVFSGVAVPYCDYSNEYTCKITIEPNQ